MKSIGSLLIAIGMIGIAVALLYGSFVVVPQYLVDRARHDCAQDYHLSYFDSATNTTITKPLDDLYRQCLLDKGL